MQVSSLGFRTDLMIRRMAGSVVEDRGDWLVVRTLANPTFWWGNFLLFPTPPATGDIRRWITVFRTEFPDAVHRAFGSERVREVTEHDRGAHDCQACAHQP